MKSPKKTLHIIEKAQNTGFGEIDWKRISSKQSAKWQHLSQLKASVFFLCKKLAVKRQNHFYLGLVMPSSV
jgi:hypothetical protein